MLLKNHSTQSHSFLKIVLLVFSFVFLFASCKSTSIEDLSTDEAMERIRSRYAKQEWHDLIDDVNIYRTRHPYSEHIREADLMQADAYFENEQYAESIASYQNFLRKNPNDSKAALASFRIARCYDLQSPDAPDREQIQSVRSLEKYKIFLENYPNTEWAPLAIQRVAALKEKIIQHNLFIARFYLKKEACSAVISRNEQLLQKFPDDKEVKENAVKAISECYLKLADELEENPDSHKSIYFLHSTPEELRQKSKELFP